WPSTQRRSRPPARRQPANACALARGGGVYLPQHSRRAAFRSRQTLSARTKSADFGNSLATRLWRGQRIHARVQTVDGRAAQTIAADECSRSSGFLSKRFVPH